MDFRIAFAPKPFAEKISIGQELFLTGSCFTEQIGSKLIAHKFKVTDNPHGILFNPSSMCKALQSYMSNKLYHANDLFFHDGLWGSWDHHTRFSDVTPETCLQKINVSQTKAQQALRSASWLIMTLGSSFVYEIESGMTVANCHKVPADKFNKRLLPAESICFLFDKIIKELKLFNPSLQIIFTISPVRHLRDGFVENNRSKANLITAVHELVSGFDHVHYFPSYELVIDDLRDYRFYAEDMVHPNYQATQYVWEKFKETCVDHESILLMKEIHAIHIAARHRSMHPGTDAHQTFLKTHIEKTMSLSNKYPQLDFRQELAIFYEQLQG
jgi:hypothetical protein